jgi:hypothetical protein
MSRTVMPTPASRKSRDGLKCQYWEEFHRSSLNHVKKINNYENTLRSWDLLRETPSPTRSVRETDPWCSSFFCWSSRENEGSIFWDGSQNLRPQAYW